MTRSTDTKQQSRGTATFYIFAQLAQACEEANRAQAEYEIAVKMREQAIRSARRLGVSLSEIAALAGISKSRVQQIVPGDPEDDEETADADDDQREVV